MLKLETDPDPLTSFHPLFITPWGPKEGHILADGDGTPSIWEELPTCPVSVSALGAPAARWLGCSAPGGALENGERIGAEPFCE